MISIGLVPLQEISLPAFKIGKYEVTNAQYKLCVTYGNCAIPLEQADYKDKDKQDYPVVFVTIFQANNFCQWIGQRILTEVEWERAARGPDGKPWPWGNQTPSLDLVNMPEPNTFKTTEGLQPVDSNSRSVSSEGVYNLVGNAYEWTSSYKYSGGNYDMTHWDGTIEDFKGIVFYATRGGSWENYIEDVAYFSPYTGTTVIEDLGFRCGATVK